MPTNSPPQMTEPRRAASDEPDVSSIPDLARRYLEPEIETATRDTIEALQESRVLELVSYAWENSPFYRDLWENAGVDPSKIRSLADFREQIPTFEKADVQAFRDRTGDPFGGLLCVGLGDLTSVTATSGTTSDPELIAEIWAAAPPLPMSSARDLWEIGLRPGDRALIPAGTFRNFYDEFYSALGLVPIFVDTWIGQGRRILEAIERYRPAYMQVYLPTILEFEELESEFNYKELFSCFKGVSFAGQPMGAVLANKVRERWGLEVFQYASAGDTGTTWEHKDHNGYMFWEDTVIPECLQPATDLPVADGEVGELVATDIDNRAAPLIRYRSGDLVRLSREPSPTGRTHARQWIVGRMGDQTVVAGRSVVVSEVWAAIEEIPELSDGLFQIIRYSTTMETLRLRVGYAPDRTTDIEDLRRRLSNHLYSALRVPTELDMVTNEEILSYSTSVAKFPRVVKK